MADKKGHFVIGNQTVIDPCFAVQCKTISASMYCFLKNISYKK